MRAALRGMDYDDLLGLPPVGHLPGTDDVPGRASPGVRTANRRGRARARLRKASTRPGAAADGPVSVAGPATAQGNAPDGSARAPAEEGLCFALLGPVRAWRGERELDLGPPQQQAVLAALLLRHGRPATAAELIDAVWGDRPPRAAVSMLRTYASRLRKALEPVRAAGEPPKVIVTAADGYRISGPGHAVDLDLFEQRVAKARKLRAEGRLSAASELLHTALDVWEGTPLAGLPGPLAQDERSRLAEVRLSVLEASLDAEVELGRHGESIAALTALLSKYPLRERLCRLLMLALYRSGRQAEALAAYRSMRSTLVAELGIEPGTSLRDLHDRMLAADPALVPVGPPGEDDAQEVSLAPAAGVRPAQLPADLATFTGRETELAQADAMLTSGGKSAAVVIAAFSGMAGAGKTTLAVHWAHRVAHRYPDGQLFLDLRGFDPAAAAMSPAEVLRVFLEALGVPARSVPDSPDARIALYRTLLADRRMLILLDNARNSEQVRPLLPGSPGCLVVVTSRTQLFGLVASAGARPVTVNPLTPAEAHAFLTRRLGAEPPTAEPRATDEIIARCGRLPLALALVAARAATRPGHPLSAVARELSDSRGSLDAFTVCDPATDLRAVFSSSYDHVSRPAARLFHLLGLVPGPDISVHAAAALAGLPLRETRTLLTELVRSHLLVEHSPGRHTVHELLRVHAAERVVTEEPRQEREGALERLLYWYLHTADAACPDFAERGHRAPPGPPPPGCHPLTFATQDHALRWCEEERPHLVAAVYRAAITPRPGTVR
ncbi:MULTISPECIES: transcriptional regulator [Streptomyces]|uniref:AfsR/SARP family transcriptional regulator n=1 Tax=Streptomyces TaxID=1883 RepID=UPI00240DBC55|nr:MULTISPECIES: transcriptional regulator [Streptomyces]WFB83607.1 transcriptional regulator [Streptomyces olivaceus]WGK45910.1 transcriptional regulator [Streptomyces sp. B146]